MFDFPGDFTVPAGSNKTANTLWDKVYNSDEFVADRDALLEASAFESGQQQ